MSPGSSSIRTGTTWQYGVCPFFLVVGVVVALGRIDATRGPDAAMITREAGS
jgi:hypothetical protein